MIKTNINRASSNKNKTKISRRNKRKTKISRRNKLKVGGDPGHIKVISYNLSWGSMVGDPDDSSAKLLAETCRDAKKEVGHESDPTVCLTNVRAFLEKECREELVDFIALQEASVSWKIIVEGSEIFKNMCYVHSKVLYKSNPEEDEDDADLCTIYNNEKFKLLYTAYGNTNKDGTDGRPYHILFLEKILDKKKYIFINFHNGHDISRDALENSLLISKINDFSKEKLPRFENIQDFQPVTIEQFIREYTLSPDTHIIMAGDTNDLNKNKYWIGIKPFKHSKIDLLKDINISTKDVRPPYTCCIGRDKIRDGKIEIILDNAPPRKRGEAKDNKYGDYIMISDELEYIQNNYIPDPDDFQRDARLNPTSDHLPVIAIIREKTKIV